MFDANGNALMSAGEWTAIYSIIAGAGLILLVAIVSMCFPRHWGD
jgi:hypothetical protein